ncbi:uncharacterized protein LOC124265887 isoform X2 [Haliotis rubra]|uniref:uncharacterized protein LOC124265887 isoform X2 n=1 Tax=Haliotis rubra TaxID=36100 RepID=UPI001EE537AE|nr:uncharacterized protein LOC124265887 isoform X2 [Haliotis rubra]
MDLAMKCVSSLPPQAQLSQCFTRSLYIKYSLRRGEIVISTNLEVRSEHALAPNYLSHRYSGGVHYMSFTCGSSYLLELKPGNWMLADIGLSYMH